MIAKKARRVPMPSYHEPFVEFSMRFTTVLHRSTPMNAHPYKGEIKP